MYSIVVPIYNEAGSVAELHRRIIAVFETLHEPFEVIFVNDGSTDDTTTQLQSVQPLTIITVR